MKKIILSLAFVCTALLGNAQERDTLTYGGEYYCMRRELSEITPVGKHNVVMFGNSLTERGLWGDYFQTQRVLNRGIGGDCVSGMIHRMPDIICGKPKAIFIMGGCNDLIFSRISIEKLSEQYNRLLDIVVKESPKTRIFIQSLLPLNEPMNDKFLTGKNRRVVEFNEALKKIAAERGIEYIDVWSAMQVDGSLPKERTIDGVHLNGAGYKVWIEVLRPYMKRF